jgi:hypothetical protein
LTNVFHSSAIAMNRFTRRLTAQSETDIALRLSPTACASCLTP